MSSPSNSRRLLERVSRNISFWRRIPVRFGGAKLRVSPGAALCYYRRLDGRMWQELFDFADHCAPPGGRIWDIGASMGVFAFSAAHRVGPKGMVLAVEADTWSAELLKRSAGTMRQNAAPVRVLCAAVAGEMSLQTFNVPERGRAAAHLQDAPGAGGKLVGGIRELHPAVTVTLDWLAEHLGAPAAIKLDIEGAELGALQGGEKVLSRARPALLIEVNQQNINGVRALLNEHRYDMFDISAGWEKRQRLDQPVYNTLALPS